jgi:hypothetical protein
MKMAMTGSSTLVSCFAERKSIAERFLFNPLEVALELLLRTVVLISKRRRGSDIIFKEPMIFIGKKVVPRKKLHSSFYDEWSFFIAKKSFSNERIDGRRKQNGNK